MQPDQYPDDYGAKDQTPTSRPRSNMTSSGMKRSVIPSTKPVFTRSFSDRPACLAKYQALRPA